MRIILPKARLPDSLTGPLTGQDHELLEFHAIEDLQTLLRTGTGPQLVIIDSPISNQCKALRSENPSIPLYLIGLSDHDIAETDLLLPATPDAQSFLRGVRSGLRWIEHLSQSLGRMEQFHQVQERSQTMAHLGYWEIDMDSRIVWGSPSARAIYGLDDGPITVRDIQELCLPQYRQAMDKAMLDLVSNGSPYDIRFRIRRATDGSIRDIHSVAEYEPHGRKVFGVIQDFTDQHINQTRLFESENRYRLLVEQLTDVAWQASPDLTITYISPSDFAMRGFLPEEVLGRNFLDFVVADSSIDLWEAVQRRRKLATLGVRLPPLRMDVEQLRRDGGGIWTEIVSTPIYSPVGELTGFLGLTRDLSQRRIAEKALNEERETLAITLQSIGDGVITTDAHGHILLFNPAAQSFTGWSAEEAIGRPLLEVFHIVDEFTHEHLELPTSHALSKGAPTQFLGNAILVARDGSERVISESASPIHDTNGEIIGVVLVFRDITERERMLESLQRTQKLDSLGVLAGGIAHDFNNLLLGIFGHLDLARVHCQKSPDAQSHIDRAMVAFERARNLTQQLLTFAKGGAPIRKSGFIEPLLHNAVQFALSGSRCLCRFDLPPDLWPCDFDEHQLAQVIDNLVLNAIQAMPKGGQIDISARNVDLQSGHHPLLDQGRYLRISVKDQGTGIPREIRERIFEPFFTTKTAGTGLGLATAFSILRRHEGSLEVESELGQGSTFHLLLPASMNSPSHSLPLSPSNFDCSRTGRILVMDDEEILLEILEDMLGALGYEVESARNTQEALDAFHASTPENPFFAVLLDLTIPGGPGGRELMPQLRSFQPDLLAIATSGYSEDPVMADPKAHQFDASLPKPYRLDDLKTMLSQMRQTIPSLSH
ncbi:MAG: hypothetical protein RL318_948 [Fibrobacterota bacterium]